MIFSPEYSTYKVDSSKFLSKDILTEFEGRGDEVHILPLSFSEYYEYKQGDKSEAYDDYSVYGGLPAVALMATEEQKSSHLTTKTFDCS